MINEKYYLGIELGSTRIKSVLINKNGKVFTNGSHTWENKTTNKILVILKNVDDDHINF